MSPEKWRRYVGIISGAVILCAVVAPVTRLDPERLFTSFESGTAEIDLKKGEEYRNDLLERELTERINSDIEERVRNEFGKEIQASVKIDINGEGKITGVKEIKINGKIGDRAAARLCEVYGVEKIITAQSGGFYKRQ